MFTTKSIKFSNIYPYIFTGIFLILSVFLIVNHELWADEMRAWNIGSASNSVTELISSLRASEGHPYLWSGLLYFISHYIVDNPEAMKVLHLAISVTTVFLILKYAPFNKILRVMLIFGYFFFYEYSIISRNYSIGILFMIVFCILYRNKYKNLVVLSIVLFFLGLGNIYSFMISIILFLYLLFEIILERNNRPNRLNKLHLSIASIIMLGSIFFMYWQLGSQMKSNVMGPSIFSIFSKNFISEHIKSIAIIPKAIIKSYLPVPNFILTFWETNIIFDFLSNINFILVYILGAILFVVPLFFLKKKVLFLYIMGNLPVAIIPIFVWQGSLRHYGHHFIILIACIWISCLKPEENYLIKNREKFSQKLMNWFLIICLASSLIGSGVAYYYDYKYPFSSAKDAANYITSEFNVDELIIIGYHFHPAETIAGYLNKELYYPHSIEENKFSKFVNWPKMHGSYDINLPIRSAYKFLLEGKEVLLIISNASSNDKEILSKNNFKKIDVSFDNQIVAWEDFNLYLFDKQMKKLCESDKNNFMNCWKPLNDCNFIIEDDHILIDVYGEDSYFESSFKINTGNDILVAINNLNCEIPNELRIYYKEKGGSYNEKDMLSFPLNAGNNDIFAIVSSEKDLESIRIDPVNTNINCKIEQIKIVELR